MAGVKVADGERPEGGYWKALGGEVIGGGREDVATGAVVGATAKGMVDFGEGSEWVRMDDTEVRFC